jgi:hypothetical protein
MVGYSSLKKYIVRKSVGTIEEQEKIPIWQKCKGRRKNL